MTANTSPKYTLVPVTTWAKLTGVDSSTDGTDADVGLVFTANSTDGSFIQKVVAQPLSTSGSINTTAASLRLYINNGSSVGTGTNNVLYRDFPLSVIAINPSGTAGALGPEFVLNLQLPPSYRLYAGVTAFTANSQWNIIGVGGDYS